MTDQNCVIVNGHVINEARSRETKEGGVVGWFKIVVNEDTKKEGKKYERKNYFKVLLFGAMVAYVPGLTKGKFISITGKMRQNEWLNDGKECNEVVIVCKALQYLEKNKNNP